MARGLPLVVHKKNSQIPGSTQLAHVSSQQIIKYITLGLKCEKNYMEWSTYNINFTRTAVVKTHKSYQHVCPRSQEISFF